ncbi:MAG: NUDIX hydrolase [Candidatus Latescibacterota bacterium]
MVEHTGPVALVREGKAANRGKWNLPGGHLELGEELLAGAARELREETGLMAPLTGFPGVYTGVRAAHCLNFVFTARAEDPRLEPQEGEVFECRWFTAAGVCAMRDEHLLSPRKLRRILQDARARAPYDLACIGECLSGP